MNYPLCLKKDLKPEKDAEKKDSEDSNNFFLSSNFAKKYKDLIEKNLPKKKLADWPVKDIKEYS